MLLGDPQIFTRGIIIGIDTQSLFVITDGFGIILSVEFEISKIIIGFRCYSGLIFRPGRYIFEIFHRIADKILRPGSGVGRICDLTKLRESKVVTGLCRGGILRQSLGV